MGLSDIFRSVLNGGSVFLSAGDGRTAVFRLFFEKFAEYWKNISLCDVSIS